MPSSRAFVRSATLLLAAALAAPPALEAQNIFHSTQSANLPTTSGLRRGSWLFEISHRFVPPVSEGSEALWGLDGPVFNRLGLSWAPAPGSLVTLQRSNFEDHLELNGRARLVETSIGARPVEVSVMGGVAWAMSPTFPLEGAEDNEMQSYVQAMVNLLPSDRLALGVVPTLIRNPRIRDTDTPSAVAIGVNGQLYLTDAMSLLGEWVFSEEQPDAPHDSGSFGVEFETRGHFFKLLVTNQPYMNPAQIYGGSASPFEADELRLGFNVTRILPF